MCGRGERGPAGTVYVTGGFCLIPRNPIDLWSNGIIWKNGVYREKREIVIFLETWSLLCALRCKLRAGVSSWC